jgi:hypothetical protein
VCVQYRILAYMYLDDSTAKRGVPTVTGSPTVTGVGFSTNFMIDFDRSEIVCYS